MNLYFALLLVVPCSIPGNWVQYSKPLWGKTFSIFQAAFLEMSKVIPFQCLSHLAYIWSTRMDGGFLFLRTSLWDDCLTSTSVTSSLLFHLRSWPTSSSGMISKQSTAVSFPPLLYPSESKKDKETFYIVSLKPLYIGFRCRAGSWQGIPLGRQAQGTLQFLSKNYLLVSGLFLSLSNFKSWSWRGVAGVGLTGVGEVKQFICHLPFANPVQGLP